MKRPFSITALRDAAPGVLDLRLLFRDAPSEPQRVGWHDIIKTFVDLANSGALAGSAISPRESGCALDAARFDDRVGRWRLPRTNVDRAAFTPLVNLCHWGHLNASELVTVAVSWERGPDSGDAERPSFPGVHPNLSYELKQYELAGQTTAIDIEFRTPQSAESRELINDTIGFWFKAANWGGYADDRFPLPGSTVIIAPEVMTSDATNITWYIESFRCADEVLDGLVNCLERVSLLQAPIRRVTIGE